MNAQEIAQRILRRIEEEYKNQIKPQDNIPFEEFKTTCLSHLDISSYSQKDLKYYKIGEAGILVCPKCKRNLDKTMLKKDEQVEELKEEVNELNNKIRILQENKPTIMYDSLRGKNIVK